VAAAVAVGVSSAIWDDVPPGPGDPPELQPDKARAKPTTRAAAPDLETLEWKAPDGATRDAKEFCDVMGR